LLCDEVVIHTAAKGLQVSRSMEAVEGFGIEPFTVKTIRWVQLSESDSKS
jgi:hypothetical protein